MRSLYRRWRLKHPRNREEFLESIRCADNGDRITLYEGEGDSWFPHPDGIAIRKGQQLFLNGKELLLDGSPSSTFARHPKGFLQLLDRGDKMLLNGTDMLFDGLRDEYDGYAGHHEGLLLRMDRRYVIQGPSGSRRQLYEGACHAWGPHPEGMIIQNGALFLNGETQLYDGKWDNWRSHPNGFVINRDKKIFFNGEELMYDGPHDDWSEHRHGLLIRRGKSFQLVVYRPFDPDRVIV